MDLNFIWSTPSAGGPIVSIAEYGITFNAMTIELLRRPKQVMIGYEQDKNIVGIKPIYNEDENKTKAFTFIERERHGSVRIGNKDFVKYIGSKSGLDFSTSRKFIADWDGENEMIIVDLNKPLDSSSNDSSEENN